MEFQDDAVFYRQLGQGVPDPVDLIGLDGMVFGAGVAELLGLKVAGDLFGRLHQFPVPLIASQQRVTGVGRNLEQPRFGFGGCAVFVQVTVKLDKNVLGYIFGFRRLPGETEDESEYG